MQVGLERILTQAVVGILRAVQLTASFSVPLVFTTQVLGYVAPLHCNCACRKRLNLSVVIAAASSKPGAAAPRLTLELMKGNWGPRPRVVSATCGELESRGISHGSSEHV